MEHENGKILELSPREKEIFDLATSGYTDKEIAARLGIQASTIKSYWLRIRQKTRSITRTQAISFMSSRSVSDAESDWLTVLLDHAPFSVIVCNAQSVILDAKLGGHAIAQMIIGLSMRDCLTYTNHWDGASRRLADGGSPEPMQCDIAYQGWKVSLNGTLIQGRGGTAEISLIYLIDKVDDHSVLQKGSADRAAAKGRDDDQG